MSIFGSNRLHSIAIDSQKSTAIARSIAIGSIRLLSMAIAFSASAAIESAGEWAESAAIRFESREWAADVMAGAEGNSSIAIEGGRLQSNALWAPPKTHLVLNTVYVPSGITLTIATNCVVKFCPGTCIKVEDGGKLNMVGADGGDVILTAANDATVGEPIEGFDAEQSIAFDGIRLQSSSATFTDNGWLEARGFDYGAFPGVSVNATEAVRNGGMAYVPFTLSGSSRDKAFSVEWEAVAGTATYGDDYTLASGRITWNKSGDGTKTVYFEVSPLQYGLWTAGKGTFMDELATICGLKNAFDDVDDWASISEEQVIARDPDYIVTITMYYGEGPMPVDEILGREGWQDMKAVKNGQVFNASDSNALSRPGPRLKDAAVELYNFIYGGQAEVEPAA